MHNWREVVLKQTETIEKAIQVLDKEALRIAMVVDNDKRLIGTITDGDVRRGLIRHLSMDAPVTEIMFRTPAVASIDYDKTNLISKMNELGLLQMPVVDNERRVVGLKTIQSLLEKSNYDNPVFLMAGGFGKRLSPLTEHTPKPLLKVGGKPILENILEQFINSGFNNFYISTHYKAEMIREYFGDGSKWNIDIKYTQEEYPLGTAGSIGLLPKNLPDLPLLVMNGDLLTKIDFEELLKFHMQQDGDATMCVRAYDFQVPYGVVEAKGCRITSIAEKPMHKFFVNAGVYVLNPMMLKNIDGVNYLDMPQLLKDKINNSGRVNMFPVHEYWLDIGEIKQFNQAQLDLLKLIND